MQPGFRFDPQPDIQRHDLERQCLKCVPHQQGGGLVVGLVAGGFAAPQVIVVHGRQVIMHQGIGVNQLHRTGRRIQGFEFRAQCAASGIDQTGTQAFAAIQSGVAHCLVQSPGFGPGRREQGIQRRLDPLLADRQKLAE